jgi:hypothetical protein
MAINHSAWLNPMPLDETATKRAILWSSIALVAIAALALTTAGWDDAFWWLSLAPLVWPIAVWHRRKKSIAILKHAFWQSPATHDESAFPVLLTVSRGMWLMGQDVGYLRFENHRMIFEGLRSHFNLHRQDVESGDRR